MVLSYGWARSQALSYYLPFTLALLIPNDCPGQEDRTVGDAVGGEQRGAQHQTPQTYGLVFGPKKTS